MLYELCLFAADDRVAEQSIASFDSITVHSVQIRSLTEVVTYRKLAFIDFNCKQLTNRIH